MWLTVWGDSMVSPVNWNWDFCDIDFCSTKTDPWDVHSGASTEKRNGCGKPLKEEMRGICGTLWILLQLEQNIQLPFRISITRMEVVIKQQPRYQSISCVFVYVYSHSFFATKLDSSLKSDLLTFILYWGNVDYLNCDQNVMVPTGVSLAVANVSRTLKHDFMGVKCFCLCVYFTTKLRMWLERQMFFLLLYFTDMSSNNCSAFEDY